MRTVASVGFLLILNYDEQETMSLKFIYIDFYTDRVVQRTELLYSGY